MSRSQPVAVERRADGGWVVRSPGVGRWTGPPSDGALVGAGSSAGRLRRLSRELGLYLPEGCAGRVAEVAGGGDREVPVGWGDVLFVLAPVGDLADAVSDAAAAGASSASGLRAPTDGVFYARPAPDEEPFVASGARVRRGQPVGLIEVMKTFSQVLYEGEELPDPGVVVRVLVGDGEEVVAGQPLLEVEAETG